MSERVVSDEQLAEWERRVEAATDGEWYVQRRGGSPLEVRAAWPDEDLHLASVEYLSDADLIVAARNAFPLLVRALRDARDEVEKLRRENDDLSTRDYDAGWEIGHDAARDEIAAVAAERDSLRAVNERLTQTMLRIGEELDPWGWGRDHPKAMNALMRIDGCLGPDAETPWRRRERIRAALAARAGRV